MLRNRRRTSSGEPLFNPKRSLKIWGSERERDEYLETLRERVRYTGSPCHKRNPGDFGLTPPAAPRQNATLCDDAGLNRKADATRLLRAGVVAGLLDARLQNGFPSLIWSVRDDGLVFEAQLENQILGQYHGYPMPVSDPFRDDVLRAFQANAQLRH